MNIQEIAEEHVRIMKANGWANLTIDSWDNADKIPAQLALIHSEVSEALEAFRKDDMQEFRLELADVFLRTLGLAYTLGIDLEVETLSKMEVNRHRGFKHGGMII